MRLCQSIALPYTIAACIVVTGSGGAFDDMVRLSDHHVPNFTAFIQSSKRSISRNMSNRRRIACSNHPELPCLAVSGADLRIYQRVQARDSIFGCRIRQSNAYRFMCCAWGMKNLQDFIAIGYSNGRVLLSRLSETNSSYNLLKGLEAKAEFLPRHSRSCTTVGFCPTQPELLFSGLEKVRNDHCLLVWDVNITSSLSDLNSQPQNGISILNTSPDRSIEALPRGATPLAQLGSSESIASASWFHYSSPRIVAGMGAKWIRSYDLRNPSNSNPIFAIPTKAVNSIVTDPFFTNRFASFGDDSIIRIWDDRKPVEPVLSLPVDNKFGVSQIAWSPDFEGVICSMGRDSDSIRFLFINNVASETTGSTPSISDTNSPNEDRVSQRDRFEVRDPPQTAAGQEDTNDNTEKDVSNQHMPIISKIKQVVFSQTIHDFSWIPKSSIASLGIPYVVGTGKDFSLDICTIPTSCHLDISATNELIIAPSIPQDRNWNFGSKFQSGTEIDICDLMRTRALAGYCEDPDINLAIVDSDPELQSAWHFISNAQAVVSADMVTPEVAFQGVLGLIQEDKKYEEFEVPTNNETQDKQVFYGGPRRRAGFAICGWIPIDEEDFGFTVFAKHLESLGKYERAAFITYFESGRWTDVIDCLRRSEDERLQIVSAALAGSLETSTGASKDLESLWRSILDKLRLELKSPFLRALFALVQDPSTKEYLNYEDLPLVDKVGSALRTLGNNAFLDFVDAQYLECMTNCDISGLLLSGLSPKGVGLAQSYLDRKGDIQSVCLLVQHAPGHVDDLILEWTELYRDFLDQLQLFHIRARFDIARQKLATAKKIPKAPQVFIRCQFCGFPLSKAGHSLRAGPPTLPGTSGSGAPIKLKAGCPQCRKPLPRCAICLLNMGVPLSQERNSAGSTDSWFVWCQSCHHGGHAKHLNEWFATHSTCPVSNCDCHCNRS